MTEGAARRRRIEGGRHRVVKVRFTEAEHAELVRAAAGVGRQGVTVQRYLVEAAMRDTGEGMPTVSQWHAVLATMLRIQRQVVGIGTNLNQLAHVANGTGAAPAGIAETAEQAREVLGRVAEVVTAIGGAANSARRPRS